jgi:hypothetical protein
LDTATYADRTTDQTVTIDDVADDGDGFNDGTPGARDNVRTDVESVTTGSGNDTINSVDGNAGTIICGPGDDTLTKDPADEAVDCENVS